MEQNSYPDGRQVTAIMSQRRYIGRGSNAAPPSRFERIQIILDEPEDETALDDAALQPRKVATQFYDDQAQSIIRANDSPDLPFRFSINPYRGCEHGCAYCYARPTHETLGWNAGIDFETRILMKRNAAELLRRDLMKATWSAEPITISGVTDCYQPIERKLCLTRDCLAVMAEAGQPFSIVTKNALVLRDLDLLADCARRSLVHVYLSITTLDESLARTLEPRTSAIRSRLEAVRALRDAGIPVAVFVAPIIPALNDHEIPSILQAAKEAGAQGAGWQLLRLPLNVLPVFQQWLADNVPNLRDRVESRIRECRDGRMNEAQFHARMRGTGPYAEHLRGTFLQFAARLGLDQPLAPLDSNHFQPPRKDLAQRLFEFMEGQP